jgi:signal transduction histidine kinase
MSSPATEFRNGTPSQEPEPQSQSFWSSLSGALLLAILCTLLVFFVSSAADLFLLHEHETARITIELSDGVAAVVIGVLCYWLVRLHQDRRRQLRDRVEMIADMNHHVRNALQIISLTSHGKTQEEIAAIRESVGRIQWALRELLPKI